MVPQDVEGKMGVMRRGEVIQVPCHDLCVPIGQLEGVTREHDDDGDTEEKDEDGHADGKSLEGKGTKPLLA